MIVRPLGHACGRREVEVARILLLEAKHRCAVPVLLQEPAVHALTHHIVCCMHHMQWLPSNILEQSFCLKATNPMETI